MTATKQNTRFAAAFRAASFACVLTVLGALVFAAAPAMGDEIHAFSLSFGSAGQGAGQFGKAEFGGLDDAIAVDNSSGPSQGDVYVGDPLNHRVEKFSPSGEFILAFGKDVDATTGGDVCTAASHDTCQAGMAGTAPGELVNVLFIAVDDSSGPSAGDVYVASVPTFGASYWPVYKFTPEGKLITNFGSGGEVLVLEFEGIGVGSTGNLYDLEGRTVAEFSPGGARVATVRTELKNFPKRVGISVDKLGNIFLIGGNGSLMELGPSGEVLNNELSQTGAQGVALDPSNEDVYVRFEDDGVSRYNSADSLLESSIGVGEGLAQPRGIAVSASDHALYVVDSESADVSKFTLQEVEAPTAAVEAPAQVGYTTAHVSGKVDPRGHFVVSCRFEYVTSEHFASEGFTGAQSQGCSASPGRGTSAVSVEATLTHLQPTTAYHVRLVAENRVGAADSEEPSPFKTQGPITPPTVTIEPVGQITSTTARFSGHINPNAPGPAPGQDPGFDTSWSFQCVPNCPRLQGGEIEADDTTHEVSLEAKELLPGTRYEVTLVAENAGGKGTEAKVSFTTPAVPPTIEATFVATASSGEAALDAGIDPGGASTSYRFQYITEKQFVEDGETFGAGTQETPAASIGAGDEVHKVTATVAGLASETDYRFRVIATSEKTAVGGLPGPVETLYTYASPIFAGCGNQPLREANGSLELADCRAFEQVSPAGDAEVFIPFGQEHESGFAESEWPMQAATSGNTAVFVGEAESNGRGGGTGNNGGGEGDIHLAVRGEGGWKSSDIQPQGSDPSTGYMGFSSDLSTGFVVTGANEELSGGVETKCPLLYTSASGSAVYHPLFTSEPVVTECDTHLFYDGASADDSQVLFESRAALAPGAVESPGQLGYENVYDSVEGRPYLVNVLPGPSPEADPETTAGSIAGEPQLSQGGGGSQPAIDASNVISADGSRVFWTDLKTGVVYLRVNPSRPQSAFGGGGECSEPAKACTVQVSSGAATYWTATSDGRYAYYTEGGELWRFDAQSDTREALAGPGAEVVGVIGVNETGDDGSYVYFVAAGGLTSNAKARECKVKGAEEGCNLYVIHSGVTSLATVLSPADDNFRGNEFGSPHPTKGDWRLVSGYRSAELTPDGSHLVFMSYARLTAYQNVGESEIYIYDAGSGQVSCASCNPVGVEPSEPDREGGSTYLPGDFGSVTHMRRLVSADGSRVFFATNQPLVPQDTNKAQDVYEWERAGTGSCAVGSALNGGGCVYLLSGGVGGESALVDSDESGENVFFVTRTGLIPGELNETPVLYDARVNGGFIGIPGKAVEPPACEGAEACKAPPSEPPVEPFPASAAFSGSGNLVLPLEQPATETNTGPKPRKCRKGFTKKGRKCVTTRRKRHKAKGRKRPRVKSRKPGGERRAGR
jgi:hypothetical protein